MPPPRIFKHLQPCLNTARRRQNRRYYASNAPRYSPKVRAIPFALSAEEAIRQLGPYASINGVGNSMFGSLGAKFFPGFGFQSYLPSKIQPLYFPAWFIDADVTAKIGLPHHDTPLDTHVQSVNSYLPGFKYDPLSKLSFAEPSMYTLTIPFTPELTRQHGNDIICLPYMLSPLPLPQFGQSLLPPQSTIQEVMVFDSTSLSFHLLAAYPVLLPIYLAQYECKILDQEHSISFTGVIQAHSDKGTIYLEDVGSELGKMTREKAGSPPASFYSRMTRLLDNDGFVSVRGPDHGFAQISMTTPAAVARDTILLDSEVSEWLDDALTTHGLETLAQSGVDMNDLRIREYVPDEVLANRTWMSVGEELITKRVAYITADDQHKRVSDQLRQQLTGDRTDGTEHPLLSQLTNAAQTAQAALQVEIQALEQRRQMKKPQWLKDWEILQEEQRLALENHKKI